MMRRRRVVLAVATIPLAAAGWSHADNRGKVVDEGTVRKITEAMPAKPPSPWSNGYRKPKPAPAPQPGPTP